MRPAVSSSFRSPLRRTGPVAILAVVLLFLASLGLGGGPATAQAAGSVRVGLVTAAREAKAGAQGRCFIYDLSGAAVAVSSGEMTLASPGGQFLSVPGAGILPGPLAIRPAADDPAVPNYVTVGGHSYRGELEVFARDGLVTVVNVLPLEDYLLGVVPREMPSGFPAEALKAQAVAARTYALHTQASGAYAAYGYDLFPTTVCQVYGGVEAEAQSTTDAVTATAGQVITYNGVLIGAYFHSTSGGHTESVEYVWGTPSPYLKGVPDFDQASPHYTWTVSFTADDLAARLKAEGYDVGEVWTVEGVGPQGPGGRYLERRVAGSAGDVVLRSEKLRTVLGLRSAWFEVTGEEERVENTTRPLTQGSLSAVSADGVVRPLPSGGAPLVAMSADYAYVLPAGELRAVSPVLVPATFTFDGHGWGHGVGLSQWGARGMALEGKTYIDILTHYYTGVTVGTLP